MTARSTVDGSLKFKDGDANAGKTPKVIAGAYSNSFKRRRARPRSTTSTRRPARCVTQAPPNDGILNTIGSLGMKLDGAIAFNIVGAGRGQRRLARDRRHALLGRPEDRQGDVRRQARRRERQAHRHRLGRLKLTVAAERSVRCPAVPSWSVDRPSKCPPQGWTVRIIGPAARCLRSGPLRLRRCAALTPSPS